MTVQPALAAAFAAVLLALIGAAAPARANSELRHCVDPSATLRGMAEACRNALDRGGLTRQEQAAAWTNIGVALSETGRDGDALTAYDRAARADSTFAPLYVNRAISRARRGMSAGAIDDWTQAIRLLPRDWDARLGRSGVLLDAGRPAEALQDADAAVRLAPREGAPQASRSRALQALGRRDEARQAMDRAVRLAPREPRYWLRRGVLRADGDPAGALTDMTRALELDPIWASGFATRGRLLDRLGRRAEANRDFRRAFELGFQAPWLNERIEALGG